MNFLLLFITVCIIQGFHYTSNYCLYTTEILILL